MPHPPLPPRIPHLANLIGRDGRGRMAGIERGIGGISIGVDILHVSRVWRLLFPSPSTRAHATPSSTTTTQPRSNNSPASTRASHNTQSRCESSSHAQSRYLTRFARRILSREETGVFVRDVLGSCACGSGSNNLRASFGGVLSGMGGGGGGGGGNMKAKIVKYLSTRWAVKEAVYKAYPYPYPFPYPWGLGIEGESERMGMGKGEDSKGMGNRERESSSSSSSSSREELDRRKAPRLTWKEVTLRYDGVSGKPYVVVHRHWHSGITHKENEGEVTATTTTTNRLLPDHARNHTHHKPTDTRVKPVPDANVDSGGSEGGNQNPEHECPLATGAEEGDMEGEKMSVSISHDGEYVIAVAVWVPS